MRDELFTAERGRGAWLNGRPIQVSRIPELAEALLATGFPSRKRHASPNIHFYQEFTLRSHGVRRAGSAALDLAYVACGRLEAFWEFNLNPWDTAAGILLVEEAGRTRDGLCRQSLPAGQPRDSGIERADPGRAGGICSRICLPGATWRRFPRRRSLPSKGPHAEDNAPITDAESRNAKRKRAESSLPRGSCATISVEDSR